MLVPLCAGTETYPAVSTWLDQMRSGQGLSALRIDPVLERSAAEYAADLAERGVLSHVDALGRRALQRVRDHGGTAVLIGEILGSGPDVRSITSAWEQSISHSEVTANPLWTHYGAASAAHGQNQVWVVLFASHRIYPLEVRCTADGYLVLGVLTAGEAEEPLLFSGLEMLPPTDWDPSGREFSFLIPTDRKSTYHRLGYRSQTGDLVITNTFYPQGVATSDRGREPR
jgi:hypothetical protein